MATLTFTIGDKLGVKRTKPVGSTCEQYAGRTYREPCGCGRGFIEYEYHGGRRVARHRIFTWGVNFGQLEFADSCQQCADEQGAELDRELEEDARY